LNRSLAILRLALAAVLCAASTGAFAGAIVVGKDSNFQPLTAETAKKMFLGRVPTVGGQEVTVIYQQPGDARTEFETKVMGMTGAELNTYMARLIFTGEAKPPAIAFGDQSVKIKVNSTPGAIGYISDSAVDSTVRVLFTY